jgi:hypothetical protein
MREACKYAIEREMLRIRENINRWEGELAYFLQDVETHPGNPEVDAWHVRTMRKEIQKWKDAHTARTFQLAGSLFVTGTALTPVGRADEDLREESVSPCH